MSYPVPVTGLILRHIEIFLFLISVEIEVSECVTGATHIAILTACFKI